MLRPECCMRTRAVVALLTLCTANLLAAAPGNLVANPGFEHDLQHWRSSFGGVAETCLYTGEAAHTGAKCARLQASGRPVGLDNRRLSIGTDIFRQCAYELSAWIRNDGVEHGGFGLRLYFYDVAGQFVAMHGGIHLTSDSPKHAWRMHSTTFGFGTDQPIPGAAAALLVRFSLWGQDGEVQGDVWLDDVTLARRTLESSPAPTRDPVAWLWQDPQIAELSGVAPRGVRSALHQAGYTVKPMRTAQFAESALHRRDVDLIVLPYGGYYPAALGSDLVRFLEQGGACVTLGGRALRTPAYVSTAGCHPLDQAGRLTRQIPTSTGWPLRHCAANVEFSVTPSGAADDATGALISVAALEGYGYIGTQLPELDASSALLCFEAQGDSQTPLLCVELQETDGSRWKAMLELSPGWREYRLHVATFASYASEPRSTAGDYFHPERGKSIHFGFTDRMVGKGSHVFSLRNVGFNSAAIDCSEVVRLKYFPLGSSSPSNWFGPHAVNANELPDVSCINTARRLEGDHLVVSSGQDLLSATTAFPGVWRGWEVAVRPPSDTRSG